MSRERILVIRNGGLGDSLLLWPALAGLRRRHRQARIVLMGHPQRLGLLCVPGGADEARDLEGTGLHRLYQLDPELDDGLRRAFGDWDLVLVFAAAGDYALAENLSACGAGEVHAFLPEPPEGQALHVAAHAEQALLDLDLAEVGPMPLLPVLDDERRLAGEWLARMDLASERIALLAPGSGSEKKNWPAGHFVSLASVLKERGLRITLMRGPADGAAVAAVQAAAGETLPVFDEVPLDVLRGLCARAEVFVGNDSGPVHLSALLGTPTLAVFGASDPARWHPLGPRCGWLGGHEQAWPEPDAVEAQLGLLMDSQVS